MNIKSASNHHDGTCCLLKNGQVDKHVIAERVNHIKHGKLCPETFRYFDEDMSDGVVSKIEDCHHIFHAAHSFYDSGFKYALCVVVDGMGCDLHLGPPIFHEGSAGRESISVFLFQYPCKNKLFYREVVVPFECNVHILDRGGYRGLNIKNNMRVTSTCSPAQMFEKTCTSIGMNWYDAGKLMAMASYAKNDIEVNENDFVGFDLRSIELTKKLSSFQEQCDYARSLQIKSQERVKDLILKSIEDTGIKNVCLAGGYFLNCVSNTYVHKHLPRDVNVFIEPVCGDDGISIGLAKLRWYELTGSRRRFPLKNIYNGIPQEINVEGKRVSPKDVAQLLADRKVIGIFQSRSESGPRALGNRSILYDPRDPNGRDKINKLKGREDYRPLAATVLHEHAHKWFDMCNLKESPYMLYTLDVLSDEVPAICHVDKTCRVQTLKKSFNKHYYKLIWEFNHITGVPLVLNTSLNLAGDTIAETVEDAMKTLNGSEMDYLYFPEKGILVASSQTGT
mgnify:CR=1 FL=1